MRKERGLFCIFLFLFFALPLFSHSSCVMANEKTYRITGEQLDRLDKNLNILSENIKTKDKLLKIQEKELTEAQNSIKRYRILSERTEQSLTKAEELLKQSEREAKHKIKVKRRQRDMWIAISAVLAGVAIAK